MKQTGKTRRKMPKFLALLLVAGLLLGSIPLVTTAEEGEESTEPTEPVSITAFDALDASVATQQYETGKALDALNLPQTLSGTTGEESVTVPVTRWDASPTYDPTEADDYTFTPTLALPEGYALGSGVTPPTITVTLAEPEGKTLIIGIEYLFNEDEEWDFRSTKQATPGTLFGALELPSSAKVCYDGTSDYVLHPITWSCESPSIPQVADDYAFNSVGDYVFKAQFGDDYELGAKAVINIPTVTVQVRQDELPPGEGDDYVATSIAPADWFGQTKEYQTGSYKTNVQYDFTYTKLSVTITNKDGSRTIEPSIELVWPEGLDDGKPLPDGTYTLTAKPESPFYDNETSENIPFTLAEGLVLPTIVISVTSSESAETEDYTFDKESGLLTIKTDAGITAWRDGPWPAEVKSLVIGAAVKDIETPENVSTGAFEDCFNLTSVTFEEGAAPATIGNSAFRYCGFTSIDIPDSVTQISYSAFADCANLKTVSFGEASKLEKIFGFAFRSCASLEGFDMPAGLTFVGGQAFSNAGLKSVTFSPALKDTFYGTEDFETSYGLISNSGIFDGCDKLASITVAEGNTHFKSIEGVLFSADMKTLICYPQARAGESYMIPTDTIRIEDRAFYENQNLKEVNIHKDVKTIGVLAFAYCQRIDKIDVIEESTLTEIGDGAFLTTHNRTEPLKIYLPMSLKYPGGYVFNDPDNGETDVAAKIFIYFGSPMMDWCIANNCPYFLRPSSGTLQANPPDKMYEHIPYQFVPATLVPENENLEFWTEPALPEGLILVKNAADAAAHGRIPGTIYGAPLNYEPFKDGVTFTMFAKNTGDGQSDYVAQAIFTIKLVPKPTTDAQFDEINTTWTFEPYTGGDGKIPDTITGTEATVGDQIMHLNAPFALFDSLWIDGVKQVRNVHYTAEDGSTTVTIMSQTIKELGNGTHIAAAAFSRDEADGTNVNKSDLDVVAQNFTLDLSSGGNNNTGNNSNSNSDRDRPTSNTTKPNTDNTTPPTEENTNPPNETVTPPEQEPIGPTNSANPPNPTNTASTTGTNSGGNATASGGRTQSGTNQPGAPGASNQTGDATGETQTDDTITEPDITDAQEEEAPFTGLEADENGNFFFALDGSGNPFEIRIDIPLEEFVSLSFDGEAFTPDEDFTLTSGSTIITIPAERLAQYATGTHTISAAFVNETVDVTFDLQKPADTEKAGMPAFTVPLIVVGVLLLAAIPTGLALQKRRVKAL